MAEQKWHVINMDTRKPYIVELSKEYAEQFKDYLKMLYIIFEPSEAGDLINFKCWLNKNEYSQLLLQSSSKVECMFLSSLMVITAYLQYLHHCILY